MSDLQYAGIRAFFMDLLARQGVRIKTLFLPSKYQVKKLRKVWDTANRVSASDLLNI